MHFWKFWNWPNEMRVISKFLKITRVIYSKNHPTKHFWLIRSNQKRLCIETNISEQRTITNQRAGNYKTAENYKKTPSTVQTTVWLSEKSMMDLFYEIVNGLWNLFSGKIQQLSAINYFCKKLYFRYWQDYYCGYLVTNLCELNFRKGKIWWCIIC